MYNQNYHTPEGKTKLTSLLVKLTKIKEKAICVEGR